MERKVTIEDPALDTIVQSLLTLTSHVQNLFTIVREHHHFTNDDESPDGGVWTNLNDSIKESDLDSVRNGLDEIRYDLEGLRPGS